MNQAIAYPNNPYLAARCRGLHLVLPQIVSKIQATSEATEVPSSPALIGRGAVLAPAPATPPADPTRRKGPHALRVHVPGEYIAPTRQPATLGGVGCEFYRKYSEGLLRRYLKLSMEAGRVPSLLGRELFRGNVSSHKVSSFEDVAIFVHDIERCLAELSPGQRHLVRRIALEEYTQAEAAALLGMSLRTVIRRYAGALDTLTRIFLDRKLLHPLTAAEL